MHHRCHHPFSEWHQHGGGEQGQQSPAAQPTAGGGDQQANACEQQQQGQQQPQRQAHVQIHKAGTSGHTAAMEHQIEGGQGIAEGGHQRQNRQLRLQHPLLVAAEAWKAQLRKAVALAEGEPEATSQAHQPLHQHHAHQEMQRRQAQHREAQIKPSERITLAEGHRQQSR